MASLCEVLGHDKLQNLVNKIDQQVQKKTRHSKTAHSRICAARRHPSLPDIALEQRHTYIETFFEEVHPFYPVLNRRSFEELAFGYDLPAKLMADPPWCALYHTVLTLGCLQVDSSGWHEGEGKEWDYFVVSLNLLPELLLTQKSLTTVQTFLLMGTYCTCYGGLPYEELLVTEAARSALSLCLNKYRNIERAVESEATFWLVYCLEKEHAFNTSRSSLLNDKDISCPIPVITDSAFPGFDWLRTYVSFTRILSKAYERLFSINAINNMSEANLEDIEHCYKELQLWKDSIPPQFRIGSPIKPLRIRNSLLMALSVRLHLLYYNALVALSRLALHICADSAFEQQQCASKAVLLGAARSIVDLAHLLVIAPFTSALCV